MSIAKTAEHHASSAQQVRASTTGAERRLRADESRRRTHLLQSSTQLKSLVDNLKTVAV